MNINLQCNIYLSSIHRAEVYQSQRYVFLTIPCHLIGCNVTKPELTLADAAKVAAKRAKPRLNKAMLSCVPAGKLVAFVFQRQLGGCERAAPLEQIKLCTRSSHPFNLNEKLEHVLKDSSGCQWSKMLHTTCQRFGSERSICQYHVKSMYDKQILCRCVC